MRKALFGLFLGLLTAGALNAQVYTFTSQPGSEGFDATLVSSDPGGNYGSNTTIRAYRDASSNLERALLQFDLSSIPANAIVTSASLILSGGNHSSANGGAILQMVPATWDESMISWGGATLLQDATMPTVSIAQATSSTQNYTITVTDMVQTMVNTPTVNFGWLFMLNDETTLNLQYFEFGSSDNSTASKRPSIVVNYVIPMSVSAYVTPPITSTSTNGAVYLQVSAGVAPYTYSWSTGSTNKDIYNIAQGLYTVTVTDNLGYTSVKLVPVASESNAATFTIEATSGSFNSAMALNESFNDNTANKNFQNQANVTAYNNTGASGVSLARSLLAFDLSSLPANATVNSASLVLRNNQTTYTTSFNVLFCKAGGAWNQRTMTYNNEPTFSESDAVSLSYDASLTDYSINVASHVQTMISGSTSINGWVIKLQDETSATYGKAATFLGNNQVLGPKPKVVLTVVLPYSDDTQRNWYEEDTYDENGSVIASTKVYIDGLGRQTQNLSKDASSQVFTSQKIYDSYGRAAINTLPAFTSNGLTYYTSFFTNYAGQPYSYTDFDTQGTLNSNLTVGNFIYGTLGNYYSDTNPYDSYQATADNAYTRLEFTGDPGGAIRRVSKPGNAFKMGSGRESWSFTMVSGDELKNVFGSGLSYKCSRNNSNKVESDPLSVSDPIIATKKIVITPDNKEMITYNVGDKVIANCFASLTNSESCNFTSVTNTLYYSGSKSADIHLPDANKGSLTLPQPTQATSPSITTTSYTNIIYTITDLYTDNKLTANTDYSLNTSTGAVTFYTGFLSQYTGRSLMLRISFSYNSTYETSLLTASVTPSDLKMTYNLDYGHFNKNYYDLGGQLRKSVSPGGFSCGTPTVITMADKYDYDHRRRIIASQTPDEGLTETTYDQEGKPRFSQDAVQASNKYFSYINYDKHGRPIETGECHTSSVTANSVWFQDYYGSPTITPTYSNCIASGSIIQQSDGIQSADKTNTTVTGYVIPAGSYTIPGTYSYVSSYSSFRNGEINYVVNKNNIVWFNYDGIGRPKSSLTQITEPDFVTKSGGAINTCIKTSDGTYNFYNGLPSSNTFQQNPINAGEKMAFSYAYDANLRPSMTTFSWANGAKTTTLSTSSYNKIGRLNRVVLGEKYQGLDFVYTLDGSLKAINHPGLDPSLDPGGDNGDYTGSGSNVNKDLFGEILEYYNNDYQRSGKNINSAISATSSVYDGLVYATRFKTQNAVNTTTTWANYIGTGQTTLITASNYSQQELSFKYTYDQFNRLATSNFYTYNNNSNAFTTYTVYSESGNGGDIQYDKNGNITRLVRQAYNNITLDNLTYTIGTNSNLLTGILDAAYNPSFTPNFSTPSTVTPSSFGYNAIGQMTASPAESVTTVDYFPDGKIKKITFTNGNTTEYEYDAMGGKLKSKYYNASNTKTKYDWYVGPLIYEFDEAGTNNFVIVQASIPGGELTVNYATITTSAYPVYHITDHLGNVRATFKASGTGTTGIDIVSYNDYYAFGGKLPGRSYNGQISRYSYQEQEKIDDGANPWYQFDLRNYNQDIGRWFAPDPYGQNWSPYSAMANNPVSYIDPDGGWEEPKNSKYALINDIPEGGTSSIGVTEYPQTPFPTDWGWILGNLADGGTPSIVGGDFDHQGGGGGSGPGGGGMVYDEAFGGLIPYSMEEGLIKVRSHTSNSGDVSTPPIIYTNPTKPASANSSSNGWDRGSDNGVDEMNNEAGWEKYNNDNEGLGWPKEGQSFGFTIPMGDWFNRKNARLKNLTFKIGDWGDKTVWEPVLDVDRKFFDVTNPFVFEGFLTKRYRVSYTALGPGTDDWIGTWLPSIGFYHGLRTWYTGRGSIYIKQSGIVSFHLQQRVTHLVWKPFKIRVTAK